MEQYVVINIEKTKTISAVLERHILRVDIRYEDGKKIGFRDGLRAIYCIWKYRKG